MHGHRYQHNLSAFSTLKMEPNKEHVRHYLLFCFYQNKSATDAHKIICET